jgi:hypothetical protein
MELYRRSARRNFLAALGGLSLAACKKAPETARVDPALAPLVPADATTVVGVRVDLLKKTPLWGQLAGRLLKGLGERTGMDVDREIYELVYCAGGKNPLALLRGKWTNGGIANSGLEPELKIPGGTKLPYKGFVFQGREDAAVVFFNSSVALAGKAAALRDAIDARNSQQSSDGALARQVAQLPHAAQVYLVSTKPELPAEGLAGLRSMPFRFRQLTAWMEVNEGVKVRAQGLTGSEAEAQQAMESMKGLWSLLRTQKEFAGQELRLGAHGALVSLETDLGAAEMSALLELLN